MCIHEDGLINKLKKKKKKKCSSYHWWIQVFKKEVVCLYDIFKITDSWKNLNKKKISFGIKRE